MSIRARPEAVSEAATHRLSLLLRCLKTLEAERATTTSSRELAERFGLNSAQIRKDLAQFGDFGIRGVGYRVGELRDRLRTVLGLDRTHRLVIVGAGNLGVALADSRNFNGDTFKVVALFDVDGRKIGGKSRTGIPIRDATDLPRIARESEAEIGILAVPVEAAPEAAARLIEAGIQAILNFAPIALGPMPPAVVKNVDLTLFLESLSFQLAGRG